MHDTPPDTNLYAPPTSEVRPDIPADVRYAQPFHVVHVPKFCVLFLATFGLYRVYWFYKHWQCYRQTRGRRESIWPVPRAVFSIFFTHALTARIDTELGRGRSKFQWSPGLLATTYVVVEIISNVLGRMDGRGVGSPMTGFLAIAAIVPITLTLARLQAAANHACGDPDGSSNRRFTWANACWIALGVAVWALVLLALLAA